MILGMLRMLFTSKTVVSFVENVSLLKFLVENVIYFDLNFVILTFKVLVTVVVIITVVVVVDTGVAAVVVEDTVVVEDIVVAGVIAEGVDIVVVATEVEERKWN